MGGLRGVGSIPAPLPAVTALLGRWDADGSLSELGHLRQASAQLGILGRELDRSPVCRGRLRVASRFGKQPARFSAAGRRCGSSVRATRKREIAGSSEPADCQGQRGIIGQKGRVGEPRSSACEDFAGWFVASGACVERTEREVALDGVGPGGDGCFVGGDGGRLVAVLLGVAAEQEPGQLPIVRGAGDGGQARERGGLAGEVARPCQRRQQARSRQGAPAVYAIEVAGRQRRQSTVGRRRSAGRASPWATR